ncbi:minor tail protein T [Escherichia coli]|nr:minor tail protein T [Escherichia coli]
MLPSETMIWQPEFTDKTLSRKPGAVHTHYFHDVLLDMHFSGLTYTVLSLFFSDPDMHPLDFSLLNRREADEEPEDDVLMQKAAGLAGGVRFGPDGNEVIPASPDVADMTEDDVMLMTVSEGIAGGVRYG